MSNGCPVYPPPDLARIGLPLQIGGAAGMGLGLAMLRAVSQGWHFEVSWWWVGMAGLVTHIIGDALFFFQMRRQRCL